jgi:hypothetical protein
MLIAVILLSFALAASILAIILLYKAGVRQMEENDLLASWIENFRRDVLKTANELNELDSQQIFQKDDEVGVVFQDIVLLINELNERTQEEGD